jgi:hypothetical protein
MKVAGASGISPTGSSEASARTSYHCVEGVGVFRSPRDASRHNHGKPIVACKGEFSAAVYATYGLTSEASLPPVGDFVQAHGTECVVAVWTTDSWCPNLHVRQGSLSRPDDVRRPTGSPGWVLCINGNTCVVGRDDVVDGPLVLTRELRALDRARALGATLLLTSSPFAAKADASRDAPVGPPAVWCPAWHKVMRLCADAWARQFPGPARCTRPAAP